MSSTNRGSRRATDDYYATPGWCVERLVEALRLPGGRWLEPAAGDGAIVRAIDRRDVAWELWELRDTAQDLGAAAPVADIHIGDFLAASRRGALRDKHFAVALTNPPFTHAQEFVESCLACADTVVMLLRLNYLAAKKRWNFMSHRTPDVYVLPNRPSFTGRGTDSIDYAWFVWTHEQRSEGRLRILGLRS